MNKDAIPLVAPPWLPVVLLGGLSVVYYASYFDAGFNIADEGNYAQFAYELSLGTSLNDLPVSYGLLWFKIGEALFRLFGADLVLVRLLFFACILATTLLVYAALVRVTGWRWFAAAVALVPALAPAFPPTTFYGLCVLINCVPQLRLAQRIESAVPGDAALAGAALALSFQIRPDFGYIFLVPLGVLLFLSARRAGAVDSDILVRLAGAATIGFVIAHLPGVILAVEDGYLGTLIGQYISYPLMLADYGLRGISALFSGPMDGASALLQRPRLFSAASSAEERLALLVYLPPVIVGAYTAYTALTLRGASDRLGQGATALVVLVTGVAALPHYFFYRPDLSHIANFMPGFTVLAGVIMWRAFTHSARGAVFAAPIAFVIALYLWSAFAQEGSGSMAGSLGRTERFTGENGVDVRLHPAEKVLYEDLKAIIAANSAPGDAIVCVPYCPGIAFMTGRRLLFREQYVDDTLPARNPAWIEEAIALTRERRPPVVIVMDWAINGTDISRFSRWASPYMEALEGLAREKLERPGLAIYLL